MLHIPKKLVLVALISFLAGILWFVMVRFVMYKSNDVHYHANFAVYIDGQREAFDNFTFYEEVASCGADELNNPKARGHMHDSINHVVHVHDNAVTWGHFFANLGYTLGNDILKTDKGRFVSGEDAKELKFILNDTEVSSIANQTIRSEDVLLIDYGISTGEELKQRYDTITRDAAEYNRRADPSACTGSQAPTFADRFEHALGL